MESRRPQLSLDELHQLKWLLGAVLTLLAVSTVFYMDIDAWTLLALTAAGTCAVLARPTLPARVPSLAHTLAFPAIVAFFAVDLWLQKEVLPAMVRLDILLLLYRTITYRQRRDDLQIIVLGLFLIIVAGVLTVSLTFAAHLLLYTGCALGFLLLITLVDSAAGTHAQLLQPIRAAPAWAQRADWRQLFRRVREVTDWRVVSLGAGLFVGVVAVSALLFLAIPRFQLESGMFLDRFITKKARTGFSDTIHFGDVTDIQQDNGVALTVDVSDQTQIPATPYWRMLVLDQYDNGTFRLSTGLQRAAFEPERATARVIGAVRPRRSPAVVWTFYLEPGVSRYLPLLGPFEVLQFQEIQNFRFARSLGIIALRDDPVSMTAYRAERFELGNAMPDPMFAQQWRTRRTSGVSGLGLQIVVVVNAADSATLSRVVAEIKAGDAPAPEPAEATPTAVPKAAAPPPVAEPGAPATLSAADFAQRAIVWLRRNHAYSLSPTVPAGGGDPLVRWLASREAGHCELFAGALVLLARTAGYPAHVVTGFRGGSWNVYSNNFTLRNADAHAWAEIFDAATGAWLRADALGTSAEVEQNAPLGAAALAHRIDRSWSARLDSLRVFWYRRIVSFDQQAQAATLKAMKQATENSGRQIRAAIEEAFAALREWVKQPWSGGRLLRALGTLVALGGLGWAAWQLRFRLWQLRGRRRDGAGNPVRLEAGQWLARLMQSRASGQSDSLIRDLQRLRFGARATWPEPRAVFRRARQALRAAHRERFTRSESAR